MNGDPTQWRSAKGSEAGFTQVTEHRIVETRRTYPDREAVRADICARTGRSILHKLTDGELGALADNMVNHLPAGEPIEEVVDWDCVGCPRGTRRPAPNRTRSAGMSRPRRATGETLKPGPDLGDP